MSQDVHQSWIDGLVAIGSGVVLWVLSWVRDGIKDNRDTHRRLEKAVDGLKNHLEGHLRAKDEHDKESETGEK